MPLLATRCFLWGPITGFIKASIWYYFSSGLTDRLIVGRNVTLTLIILVNYSGVMD
jgi:hypothetical protein